VEEVGLNQCDAYCQHCFWVFSFSSDEVQPVDCRSIPDTQCILGQGWILSPGPLKAKLSCRGWGGSGGRGPRLSIVGRACEASVGERAVQEQAPLGASREGVSL